MTLFQDALVAATARGVGSAATAPVVQHVSSLAQMVREYATTLSAETVAQQEALYTSAHRIATSQNISWESRTSDLYNDLVRGHLQRNQDARGTLETAAEHIMAAGDVIAHQLEALAIDIRQAGAGVDAAISAAASHDSVEDVLEVFADATVGAAESALYLLLNNPLIDAAQQLIR
ncbi:hypothetical protein [Rothia sp. ZJ1223]|uniref:hypothetical protein n=1 Tax=Rothia sp. ZJ1223 TaxID=2811098 RepID=UPI00195EDB5E|nr:hypothetical protein [Rothia sp. ZJ1223]MBM7052086.1 hypothetical protein [Rothia sp. ZJ1223]